MTPRSLGQSRTNIRIGVDVDVDVDTQICHTPEGASAMGGRRGLWGVC